MDKGDLLRIDKLGEEVFQSFGVVAGDDNVGTHCWQTPFRCWCLLEEEFYGSQKDELIAEVFVGSISDDEDGLSVDGEV